MSMECLEYGPLHYTLARSPQRNEEFYDNYHSLNSSQDLSSTNYSYIVPTTCDSTINEGLFHTIFSIRVTSAPFTRIINDVYLDARQPSINRVFSSMIPNQSRRIIS